MTAFKRLNAAEIQAVYLLAEIELKLGSYFL
jgi:hypothetical protein